GHALGGGDAAYGLLFGAVFVGLGTGIAFGPSIARDLARERIFGIAIVGAGAMVLLMSWTFTLWIALLLVVFMGFFAGIAYLAGFTLLGTEVEDSIRGRTFAIVQSLVRAALILSLAVVPFGEGLVSRATFEPGATPSGAGIRAIVLDRAHAGISSRSEALLYAADRAQHVHDVLRPALDAGEVVITDRFIDSSLAYQGAGRTIPMDDVRMLSRWATEGLQPDLTVLLDLPPEVGLARAHGRAAADRLESESLDFHQRVRRTFTTLAEAEPDRYLVLDARRSPDELAAAIRVRVSELLQGLPLQQLQTR